MPSYYRDPSAPEPNVPRRVAVTALIVRDDDYLVERRADDPDVWAFVGGALEEDERVLDALRREIREETGFEVEHAELVGVFSDPSRIVAYPDGNVCRILSLAFRVVPSGAADPRTSAESAEMRFVSGAELAALPFWAAQLPIRAALLGESGDPVVQ